MLCGQCEGEGKLCDRCGAPAILASTVNIDICQECYLEWEKEQEKKYGKV
jgi:ribosomal protein S27AE